jgi:hypothetical protein
MAELSLEAEGVAAPSAVLFKKRSSRPKGNIRGRLATPISSQTDDTSDYPSSKDDCYNVIEPSAGTRTAT